MNIDIHHDTTLRHIQRQFAAGYPYLKLVFLLPDIVSGEMKEVQVDRRVRDLSAEEKSDSLKIDPADTIADVEIAFVDKLGLQVKVLQHSHGHWIEPGGKGKLPLTAQNAAGAAAADHIIHPDYDSYIEKQDN